MSNYTPGPWEIKKQWGDEWWFGGRNGAEIIIQSKVAGWNVVAVTGAKMDEIGIDDANARLMAAAPELLEALQSIVRSLSDQDDEGLIEHAEPMINARAAIAKALGTTEATR